MRIDNVATLKKIFMPFAAVAPKSEDIHYLLINTDNHGLETDLNASLTPIENPNQLIALGLIVAHREDRFRIDSIFVVCQKQEFTPEFMRQIVSYVSDKPHEESILSFLRKKWAIDPASHALTFFWTTQTDYTHISDCAIAPAYQRKGLMKTISLELIAQLEKFNGMAHVIQALIIHKATYRFFNPNDKECSDYRENSLEDKCCSVLREMHGLNSSSEPPASSNEDSVSNLMKFSFWHPDGLILPRFNGHCSLKIYPAHSNSNGAL